MADSRSLAVIAGSYLIGVGFYSQLPGPYLPGDQDVPFVRPMIAFLVPTAAAVTYAILRQKKDVRTSSSSSAFFTDLIQPNYWHWMLDQYLSSMRLRTQGRPRGLMPDQLGSVIPQ